MTVTVLLWSVLLFISSAAATPFKETENNCVISSLPDEEVQKLRDMSHNLSLFLHNNLQGGHETLRTVLKNLGAEVEVPLDSPLEEYLIQYQKLVHTDLKNMINQIEGLFLDFSQKLGITMKSSNTSLEEVSDLDGDTRSNLLSQMVKPEYRYLITDDLNAQITEKNNKFISKFQNDFPTTTTSTLRPSDCSDLLISGVKTSGVYTIYPFRCFCSPGIKVYCDMETNGGGWTVFLNRRKQLKQEDFNRNWAHYKKGFGKPEEEFWLGNEALYLLTNSREYTLRVDANDTNGWHVWGEWGNFKIHTETLNYRLSLTGFDATSKIYDRLSTNNGQSFTTVDRDNDKNAKNCAATTGGFWYNTCSYHFPTAAHGQIWLNPWSRTDKTKRSATELQMKIRPKICSDKVNVAKLNLHNCYTTTF